MKSYYQRNKHKWFRTPEERRKTYLTEKATIQNLTDRARYRSRRDNREFNITKADVILPKKCPVLGVPIILGHKHFGPSMDRVDNKKGYIKGNIRIISKRANTLKSDATREELKKIIEYIDKHK